MKKYRIVKAIHDGKMGFKVERERWYGWSTETKELGWICTDDVFYLTQRECQGYINNELAMEAYLKT